MTVIELVQAGDRDAMAALLKNHDATVRRAVETAFPRRWRAELDVDDVLSVTYTDAFLVIRQFSGRDEPSFGAWLRQIALHNLHDAIRNLEADKRGGKARRISASGTTDASQSLLDFLLGPDSMTPSRVSMRIEREQALRVGLESLPDAYRRAIQLYDLEGRSIQEAAAALKRTPGAVHLLRVRAHARLREILIRQASIFRSSP